MDHEDLLRKVLLELNQMYDITPDCFDSGRFTPDELESLEEFLEEAED